MVYMRIHEQDSLEGIYVTDWQGVIIMPTILVDYENVIGVKTNGSIYLPINTEYG